MEDLARLKQNLVAGERGEFPPGTNKRGDSWFFVVDTPKSWRDASIFAEAHGGHLATLADETEQAWLSNKVPEDTMVWLGGVCTGGKEWRWIDGSKWLVNNPFTGTVKFACLSDLGTLRSKARGEQLKFVIQWRQNGKNPGSLDSQLGRLKASLGGGGEPLYPAETLSRLGSHYLIVERALSWSDAVRFAEDLDGYLGVPEDKAESTFLREAVTEALPHGSAAWIGGEFKGGRWVWATTGERVSFGDWVGNSPDGNEEQDIAMRIVAGNGAVGGWDDADPDDRGAISAFVIEWGKVNRDLGQNPDLRPVDDVLNERRDKAQELVKDAQDDHAKKLLANGDSMRKDLNFWQAGLPRGAIKGKMAVAVALVNGLVDATGRIGDPPPGMRVFILPAGYKIWQDAVAEQKKIDADHEAELDRFRRFYLSNLQKDLDAVQEAGMKPEVRTIQKEIDACGPDGQSFLLHLEGEP